MKRLVIYRNILSDPRIKLLIKLLDPDSFKQSEEIYYELCSITINNQGIDLKSQIIDIILSDERRENHSYSKKCSHE